MGIKSSIYFYQPEAYNGIENATNLKELCNVGINTHYIFD